MSSLGIASLQDNIMTDRNVPDHTPAGQAAGASSSSATRELPLQCHFAVRPELVLCPYNQEPGLRLHLQQRCDTACSPGAKACLCAGRG